VHPSDIAVALAALQAQISIAGPAGNKAVKIEQFFVSPKKNVGKENMLLPGEIVTDIKIPPANAATKSSFRKIAARGSWDFALVSVAVALGIESDGVRSVRIALGGVGPYPWRVEAAEKMVVGKKLDSTVAAAAAEAAVSGAMPLRDNAYKLDMIRGVIEESLMAFI
jgi:xanthine dehydrogenase YagS FAD-binding subunit